MACNAKSPFLGYLVTPTDLFECLVASDTHGKTAVGLGGPSRHNTLACLWLLHTVLCSALRLLLVFDCCLFSVYACFFLSLWPFVVVGHPVCDCFEQYCFPNSKGSCHSFLSTSTSRVPTICVFEQWGGEQGCCGRSNPQYIL